MEFKSKRKGEIATRIHPHSQKLNFICNSNKLYGLINVDEQGAGYRCKYVLNEMKMNIMRIKVIIMSTSI